MLHLEKIKLFKNANSYVVALESDPEILHLLSKPPGWGQHYKWIFTATFLIAQILISTSSRQGKWIAQYLYPGYYLEIKRSKLQLFPLKMHESPKYIVESKKQSKGEIKKSTV